MDSEIHNSKKTFWIHQFITEIRLLDSTIKKLTIYAKNFFQNTPSSEKMIQFWTDEFVAHSQIPIFSNHKNAITTMLLKKTLNLTSES